jgi:hypothetical protein
LKDADGIDTLSSAKLGKWDGKNDSGERAASGVYIYILKCDAGKRIEKVGIFW